jgi:hypothetical protein
MNMDFNLNPWSPQLMQNRIKGKLRSNFVPTNFVGFLGFWAPCFRHEHFAWGIDRTVSQSGHFHMVQSGGMRWASGRSTPSFSAKRTTTEGSCDSPFRCL